MREAFEGAIRRGPPKTFSVRDRRDDDGRARGRRSPTTRRASAGKRSIEVLEERARTLHAALSVEQADDGTTMRLVLPTYAGSE